MSSNNEVTNELFKLAQQRADLIAALRQWKCPGCGGRGEYEHHGQKQKFERTGKVRLAHPDNKVTDCKKCGGNGLHPTAAAAIVAAGAKP